MATLPAPAQALDVTQIRSELGLSRDRLSRLLDVAPKTIERWERQAALPAGTRQRQQLSRLKEIAELGLTVYTPAGFHLFLRTPLPVFGNRTALQLIETGEAELVLGALASDYEGLGF